MSKRGQPEGSALIEAGGPEAQFGATALAFGLALRAFRLQKVEGGDEALVVGFAAHAQGLCGGVVGLPGGVAQGDGLLQFAV